MSAQEQLLQPRTSRFLFCRLGADRAGPTGSWVPLPIE